MKENERTLSEQIEQLKKEREELLRNSEQLRVIFEHSNDAIFLIDITEGRILDANRRATEMLGYTKEELLSMMVSDIHRYDIDKVMHFAEETMMQGSGWTDELCCVTKQGELLQTETSSSTVNYKGKTCLISLIRDISERLKLLNENKYLRKELDTEGGFGEIIGTSAALKHTLEHLKMVATTDVTVLITGESGTGKELIARAIHRNSKRADAPLVRVNCASIPSELFESEFFGHVKGAFTGAVEERIGRFELADKGTLFLDEVGELPLHLQGKLLRVLQEGQFERVGESRTRQIDVRIIAATNKNLAMEAQQGRFRQDLFYRLSVFPLEIPPLRERKEDIPMLATHFLQQSSHRLGLPLPSITEEILTALKNYDWPGNIRELQNTIERGLIQSGGRNISFPLPASPGSNRERYSENRNRNIPGTMTLKDLERMERSIILKALQDAKGKVYGSAGAAQHLGIPATTLAYRMKKLGITPEQTFSVKNL